MLPVSWIDDPSVPDNLLERFWDGAPPAVMELPRRALNAMAMNALQERHVFSRLLEAYEGVKGPCPKDEFRVVGWHSCFHPAVHQRLFPLGVSLSLWDEVRSKEARLIYSEPCGGCT